MMDLRIYRVSQKVLFSIKWPLILSDSPTPQTFYCVVIQSILRHSNWGAGPWQEWSGLMAPGHNNLMLTTSPDAIRHWGSNQQPLDNKVVALSILPWGLLFIIFFICSKRNLILCCCLRMKYNTQIQLNKFWILSTLTGHPLLLLQLGGAKLLR